MLHSARKENLMKNKNKLAFLSVAFATLLAVGACNVNTPSSKEKSQTVSSLNDNTSIQGSESIAPSSDIASSSSENNNSSVSSSSSDITTNKYTVTFVVEGQTVYTVEVEEGEVAAYQGAEPTKTDTSGTLYRFKGWSPDVSQPITQNTTFVAQFSAYANEQMIDDFESYEDSPSMKDEGWTALGYSNATQTWTNETGATVSLGSKSEDGQKSLRFDAWENGVGYKFAKIFQGGEFANSANALQFKLMVPQINTVKVLLHAKMTIAGSVQSPAFHYTLNVQSGDFVEYTIPLNDPNWALWGESGKSIAWAADWLGVHEDDLLNYLTRIEFYIQGNDGANGLPYVAFLDSAKFVTLNNPALTQTENLTLKDRYTAKLNDDTTLRLDVGANNAATATIIDLETPVSVNGTLAVNGRDVTFTSSALTYVGKLTNNGNLIKYQSATGTLKDLVEDVDLVGVQVVDNFEQYTSDGKAYYQNSPADQRSGCRGAYYSEYYAGSGSSPWGGNGWQLMGGDGSQLKLKQDAAGAHSGNNYLCLKNSKDKAMRYMQWGLFDGTSEQNAFRGSKFGFWAKSNGWVKSFKLYMYSQTAPTNATKDNYVKSYQFTEQEALGEWKHYEIELNPNAVYYGYMVLIEKNYDMSGNEAYLYIDDVEVYGANPYAAYVAPAPEQPFAFKPNLQYNAKINGLIQAILTPGDGNTVTISAPGLGLTVNGTYTVDNKDIAMDLGDGITYTVTASEDGYDLTFKSVTGTGAVAQALNNLSFSMLLYGDNAESYESSGTMYYQGNTREDAMSGARGAYYCDYYTGSGSSPLGGSGWSLMGGSGDQLSLDTENHHEGKQSLKLKKSSAGAMRYIQWDLYKGTARPITGVDKFTVYLKNQATSDTVLKLYVFTAQKITSSNQTTARVVADITLSASQDWTQYQIDLDPTQTYYGYGVYLASASAVGYINLDNAMFTGQDNNPTLEFYAKKDLVLNGTISAGAASIKFDDNGVAYLTCEALSASNVEGTYYMSMTDTRQEILVVVANTMIIASYKVYVTGQVEFIVQNVMGDLASYIPVGTTFTDQ